MSRNDSNGTTDSPAIRVDGLVKSFSTGTTTVTANSGISFEVPHGTVVGILGPNGAGKTTMIKSMLGLVEPDAGTIEIGGIDVSEQPRIVYENVGATLEGARNVYWRLTPRENLRYFAGLGGTPPSTLSDRHEALLEQLELQPHADKPVNELSRGMKQKVSLATTLARDVDVVVMDEPTLGLDVETTQHLREELRRLADDEDVTVLVTSHDMDVIEAVCERVLMLTGGSIVAYERVDSLLDVFRRKKYHLDVSARVSEEVRSRLKTAVNATFNDGRETVTITFSLRDVNRIHEPLDILKKANLPLVDVRSEDPTLEDVFLHLSNEGIRTTGSAHAPDEQPSRGGAESPIETAPRKPNPDDCKSAHSMEVEPNANQ